MLPNLLDDLLKAWDAKAASMPAPAPAAKMPEAASAVESAPDDTDGEVHPVEDEAQPDDLPLQSFAGEVQASGEVLVGEAEFVACQQPEPVDDPQVPVEAVSIASSVPAQDPMVDACEGENTVGPTEHEGEPGVPTEAEPESEAIAFAAAEEPDPDEFVPSVAAAFGMSFSPMDSLLSSLLASYEVAQPVEQAKPDYEPQVPESAPVATKEPDPEPFLPDVPVPPPAVEAAALTPTPESLSARIQEPLVEPEKAPVREPEPAFRLRTPILHNLSQLGRDLPATTTTKHVAVALGAQKYAVPVEYVLEAGRYPKTTYVSGLPAYVLGVFSFRGEVIPVIDVRTLADLVEDTNPADSRILTVQSKSKAGKAAFVFDSLEGIVNLDIDASVPASPASPLAPILAGVNHDGTSQFGMILVDRMLELAGCLEDDEAAA